MAKQTKKQQKKISKVMGEYKDGELKSGGSGKKVKNRDQAIAIALSEAGVEKEAFVEKRFINAFLEAMRKDPQMLRDIGKEFAVGGMHGMYSEGRRGLEKLKEVLRKNKKKIGYGTAGAGAALLGGYLGHKYLTRPEEEEEEFVHKQAGASTTAQAVQTFGQPSAANQLGSKLRTLKSLPGKAYDRSSTALVDLSRGLSGRGDSAQIRQSLRQPSPQLKANLSNRLDAQDIKFEQERLARRAASSQKRLQQIRNLLYGKKPAVPAPAPAPAPTAPTGRVDVSRWPDLNNNGVPDALESRSR
jgi:hypothetical protein